MDIIKFHTGYIEHKMYLNYTLANHINDCIDNCLYNFQWYGHTIEIISESSKNISIYIPPSIYHIIDRRRLETELQKVLTVSFKFNIVDNTLTLKF